MKSKPLLAVSLAALIALVAGISYKTNQSNRLTPTENTSNNLAGQASQSVSTDVNQQLQSELNSLLGNYRKIIVLFADEKKLKEKERNEANRVGQALFHENLTRLNNLDLIIQKISSSKAEARLGSYEQVLTYIESNPDLYDADRLAFREVLLRLQKAIASEQTLPAIKLHKRVSEDIAALNDIEKEYDKELKEVFARFETRAIELKRERWDDYLVKLSKLYNREQILKDYGVILPYPEKLDKDEKEIFGYELPSKTIVLTFDDGPHASYTEEIAAILKQYNVPGIFFQVGQNVGKVDATGKQSLNKNADTSKKLMDAGHVLANHSFSHALLSKESGDGLHAEIERTDQLLKTINAKRSPLFRFPYGAKNKEGMQILQTLGLRSVMWNIDSLDWADPVPSSIVNRVMNNLEKEKRGIVLFHDIHERTVKALPMILDKLIAEGYRFATWDGSEFSVSQKANAQAEKAGITNITSDYQNSYAIVIGINDYVKWPKLQYAVQDAKAIRETLVNRLGFSNDKVLTLSNGEATRNNILALFHDKLAHAQLKKDDRVFIFFAGHGATRKLSSGRNLGYIIPVDSDPEQISVDAIPMTDLQNIAESLNAKHVFFVMDACYSGLGLTRGGGTSAFLRENAKRIGRQMLTAGGADQLVADGGPNGHSVFTWTLLQALNGKADLNGDNLITATELAAYIAPAVSAVSQQTPAFGSLPGSEGGEFIFELKKEGEGEFLNANTNQLSSEAIALNNKITEATVKAGSKEPIVIKNLSGGEQKIAAPKLVEGSSKQMAQRANDLGLVHYREKRYAEAEAAFTEALKYRPEFALAANNLGFVYLKQQKYAEAARWFENTLQIDPSRAIAYVNLGDARMFLNENEKAKKAFNSYLELAPNGANAAYVRETLKKL
ncbi:polysaccharide deacetylase family protein [Undibacterium danionis]|uniref:Polysaccharide deacetylase family protein n=1 Tax=Undibacterium danionis TaxID=1812100 RepID=A0ABV6IF56_9BURK